MNFKLAYDYDSYGFYAGFSKAWESPLEPGVYHLPSNSTFTSPSTVASGSVAKWTGSAWANVTDNRGLTAYRLTDASQSTKVGADNAVPSGYTVVCPVFPAELLSCCSWNSTTGAWALDSVKACPIVYSRLYSAIDVKTNSILSTGFSYLGQKFACDSAGQADVTALYLEAQDSTTSYPTQFYSGTAVWTVSSAADLLSFCRDVKSYISTVKAAALVLRQQLAQEGAESADQWLARLESWTDPR